MKVKGFSWKIAVKMVYVFVSVHILGAGYSNGLSNSFTVYSVLSIPTVL